MILTRSKKNEIDIDGILHASISENRLQEILILVPTNRKLRKLKKEIIDATPDKVVTGLNLETLTTISQKLLSARSPFTELTESAAMVFIERVSKEINFKYFSVYPEGIPYGTLRRIKEVVSEYKRAGVSPDMLLKTAGKLDGAERNKTLDIYEIYKRYLNITLNLNAYEIGDVYSILLNRSAGDFADIFKEVFPEISIAVAFGFDEFTSPEAEILSRISSVTADELFINFDYYKFNPQLFSHLDKTFNYLKKKGFRQIKDKSSSYQTAFVKIVREKLFSGKKEKFAHAKEKIKIIEAPNRKSEVEVIAKGIKTLIAEKNVPPHKICVAFNLINNYSNLVRYQFSLHSIPLNITDRVPLDNSLPVTTLINLLGILESDYYYKNILRAILGGFITLKGVEPFSILSASRGLKIVAGKSNWINGINYALKNHSEETYNNLPKPMLESALESISAINNYLKPFAKELTIEEFVIEIKRLIKRTELVENILKENKNAIEKNVKAVTVFIENLEEIFGLISQEKKADEKFGVDFYLEILRSIARSSRFNVKERSDYGVLVTNIEETRGLNFDYLFIGGMIDKDFPSQYSPEVFVAEDFIKGEINHLTEQRYMFYRALSAWRKKLYLTYPLSEEKREFVESSFLKEFKNIFEYQLTKEADYSNVIASEFELQKTGIELVEKDSRNIRSAEILKRLSEIDRGKYSNPQNFPEFNGILIDENIPHDNKLSQESLNSLNKYRERVYSISQLETYAKCPFKYFVERALGIETIEEPTEDISPMEMGSIVHGILYDFYNSAVKENLFLPGCSDAVFNKAKELLFEIAEDYLNVPELNIPNAFLEKEKLLGIDGNEKDSILYRFLESERNSDRDFKPVMFETRFGFKHTDESKTETVELNGIKLRGVIDRIEINEKEKLFNVVDYKTGRNQITKNDLEEGLSLQLPVYLYAAKQILGNGYKPHQMVIYSLKYSKNDFGRKEISKMLVKGSVEEMIEANENIIENTGEKIAEYADGIAQGNFPLSKLEKRKEKVCRHCSFSPVCRITEIENLL